MPKHGGAQIAIRKGYRVAGTKSYVVKNAAILSQGEFAFGTAVEIIEYHLGKAPLCHAPQIMNIDDMRRLN
jgi:hypothetical protein